jgi:hypothetical protein
MAYARNKASNKQLLHIRQTNKHKNPLPPWKLHALAEKYDDSVHYEPLDHLFKLKFELINKESACDSTVILISRNIY